MWQILSQTLNIFKPHFDLSPDPDPYRTELLKEPTRSSEAQLDVVFTVLSRPVLWLPFAWSGSLSIPNK